METKQIKPKKKALHKADVIERFSISSNNVGIPKITFMSDEKTAQDIRLSLICDSSFWNDIQLDFNNYPTVITTIYCRYTANIDNLLELQSVKRIFLNAL